MLKQVQHDRARGFAICFFLLMVAIVFTFTCHAGLDPASHFSVGNFFKCPC